jgi:hypothetical protein
MGEGVPNDDVNDDENGGVNSGGNSGGNGDAILVRQSLASPVAPGCASDDDSKGSIARDRFNLVLGDQPKGKA